MQEFWRVCEEQLVISGGCGALSLLIYFHSGAIGVQHDCICLELSLL